jgi:hypothetical protein
MYIVTISNPAGGPCYCRKFHTEDGVREFLKSKDFSGVNVTTYEARKIEVKL